MAARKRVQQQTSFYSKQVKRAKLAPLFETIRLAGRDVQHWVFKRHEHLTRRARQSNRFAYKVCLGHVGSGCHQDLCVALGAQDPHGHFFRNVEHQLGDRPAHPEQAALVDANHSVSRKGVDQNVGPLVRDAQPRTGALAIFSERVKETWFGAAETDARRALHRNSNSLRFASMEESAANPAKTLIDSTKTLIDPSLPSIDPSLPLIVPIVLERPAVRDVVSSDTT
jgi:hypothetical protein